MKNRFEDFLEDKFIDLNPSVLDDDFPDKFDDWISQLDVADVLDYAQEAINHFIYQAEESMVNKIGDFAHDNYYEGCVKDDVNKGLDRYLYQYSKEVIWICQDYVNKYYVENNNTNA